MRQSKFLGRTNQIKNIGHEEMTDLNTQMQGESLNINEQRKKELKQLFPGVFTETKNDNGELD